METTFVLKPEELNADFIALIKKLFKNSRQLQISIAASEEFGLLEKESREKYFERISKAAADMDAGKNRVTIDEEELDNMVLSKLK